MSGKRDSNPRPRPWQGRALPTELFPQAYSFVKKRLQRYKTQDGCANVLRYFLLFAFCMFCFTIVEKRRLERPTPTSRTWCATNCATSRMNKVRCFISKNYTLVVVFLDLFVFFVVFVVVRVVDFLVLGVVGLVFAISSRQYSSVRFCGSMFLGNR